MLNAASKLKGEKDWMKYETARKLHKRIRRIRENYREDWKSKEMKIRQRAVALYFIDKVCLSVSQFEVRTKECPCKNKSVQQTNSYFS